MDLISSVFTICGTVSDTDRQYKILARKLEYEVKKTEHLVQTQKIKNAPKFMVDNLYKKLDQAKIHLQKIQSLLTQDRISFKEKIKLSLPFNKTNVEVKTALEQLQKAQQDVGQYSNSTQQQNNGKRLPQQFQKGSKKQQTMIPCEEVNDEDIDQALMGPTIQQDVAIQYTKNKYIKLNVQMHGQQKILELIKSIDKDLLNYKKKVHIKFQNSQKKDVEQLQLFSLGRLYFKSVYAKLKLLFPDIDRISKNNHFTVKLRRKRQNMKNQTINNQQSQNQQKTQEKHSNHRNSQKVQDQFFSFPCTAEQGVVKEVDTMILQRAAQKNIFVSDITGEWNKLDGMQKLLCKGEQVAPYIPLNKVPFTPQLFFKIHFEILE